MSYSYNEVNGVKVLRRTFNDSKTEAEFAAIFPRKSPNELHKDGFVTVALWKPGNRPEQGKALSEAQRREERYTSAIEFFTAPIIDGKVTIDLGAMPETGAAVAQPESLDVPEDLMGMSEEVLQKIAPRCGARVARGMAKMQMIGVIAQAIRKNPKNWETIRRELAENKVRGQQAKQAQAVTA